MLESLQNIVLSAAGIIQGSARIVRATIFHPYYASRHTLGEEYMEGFKELFGYGEDDPDRFNLPYYLEHNWLKIDEDKCRKRHGILSLPRLPLDIINDLAGNDQQDFEKDWISVAVVMSIITAGAFLVGGPIAGGALLCLSGFTTYGAYIEAQKSGNSREHDAPEAKEAPATKEMPTADPTVTIGQEQTEALPRHKKEERREEAADKTHHTPHHTPKHRRHGSGHHRADTRHRHE